MKEGSTKVPRCRGAQIARAVELVIIMFFPFLGKLVKIFFRRCRRLSQFSANADWGNREADTPLGVAFFAARCARCGSELSRVDEFPR